MSDSPEFLGVKIYDGNNPYNGDYSYRYNDITNNKLANFWINFINKYEKDMSEEMYIDLAKLISAQSTVLQQEGIIYDNTKPR